MRGLRVGDKIKWNVRIGGDLIYTVKDIDTSRPPKILKGGYEWPSQILIEFEHTGNTIQLWEYSLDSLNYEISRGKIIIVSTDIEPYKEIKKFSFENSN